MEIRASAAGLGLAFLVGACGGESVATPAPERTMPGEIVVQAFSDAFVGSAFYGRRLENQCGGERVGPCRIRPNCNVPSERSLDAGIVTVNGAMLTITNISTAYWQRFSAALEPGETLEMTATGSAFVPAHSGSVTAPVPVVLTEPDPNTAPTLDLSADLRVGWTGGAGSEMEVLLVDGVRTDNFTLVCSVSGNAGMLSIPRAALQKAGFTRAVLHVLQTNVVRPEVDGWNIALKAVHEVPSVNLTFR